MKNAIFILLSILLLTTISTAQVEWCPPGAKWIYSDFFSNPDVPSYTTINYVGDTIINGITNKILKIENMFECTDVEDRVYTYQTADSMLYAKVRQNQDHFMICDFGAVKGDSWEVPIQVGAEVDTLVYIVEADFTGPIANTVRKLLIVSKEFKNGYFGLDLPSELIIEGLGDLDFLFPWQTLDCQNELYNKSLSCYTDSLTTFRRFTSDPIECGITTSLNNIYPTTEYISIRPNPSPGVFQIGNFDTVKNLNVYDTSGRAINFERLPNNEINITDLPPGIYFIRLLTKDDQVFTGKVVKQ